MKKILFTSLTGYPNPSIGGPTRIIYEILKNLDYSKYEPYFLSYDMFKKYSSNKELDIDQNENVYTKRNFGYKFYDKINLYRDIVTSDYYLKYHFCKKDKYFFKFVKMVKDFDIIHSHDSLSAYYFVDLKKPKKILTIHSKGTQINEMKEGILKSGYFKDILLKLGKREKDAFLKFDLITFPSYSARDVFLQEIDFSDTQYERIKIIYNGIDLDRIKNIQAGDILDKYKIQQHNFNITLLNVAQHIKPKNIDLIILALKILRDEFNTRALLINVGEGYLTEDYNSIIDQNNLTEQVKFLRMIPNHDVIRLMRSLNIFIQASEKVVFDLVILEALASGIKVLASDQGGNREIIKEGVNGYFIKEMSDLCIANTILSISRQNFRLSNGTIENFFTVGQMIIEYQKMYTTHLI